jgi:hypothetical protein
VRRAALALALTLPGSVAHAQPVNSLHDLWQALGDCARRAQLAPEAAGSEVTVLFTLKRDGNLQGKPRITYSRLIGDKVDQQAFVAASLSAIAGCFPLPLTDGLGGAIAGRPIRFRLISGSRGA